MTRFTSIALAIVISHTLAAEPGNLQSKRQSSSTLLIDINTISQYWGQQLFVAHFNGANTAQARSRLIVTTTTHTLASVT